MMSNDERLAYMADQIARNFVALGEEAAVTATAEHIIAFWDPSMKARALRLLHEGAELTPLARAAFQRLESRGMSADRSAGAVRAAAGRPGGSDAG